MFKNNHSLKQKQLSMLFTIQILKTFDYIKI